MDICIVVGSAFDLLVCDAVRPYDSFPPYIDITRCFHPILASAQGTESRGDCVKGITGTKVHRIITLSQCLCATQKRLAPPQFRLRRIIRRVWH
jgi:hypothetical protein